MVLINYLHKGIQHVLLHTGVLEEVYFDILSFSRLFVYYAFSLFPLGGGSQGSKASAEKAPLRLRLLRMWGGHKDTTQVICGFRSPALPIL
jgi:hypothetical protein